MEMLTQRKLNADAKYVQMYLGQLNSHVLGICEIIWNELPNIPNDRRLA